MTRISRTGLEHDAHLVYLVLGDILRLIARNTGRAHLISSNGSVLRAGAQLHVVPISLILLLSQNHLWHYSLWTRGQPCVRVMRAWRR